MCGDHERRIGMRYRVWGSPPHVRGPLVIFTNQEPRKGITPACAGTTNIFLRSCQCNWDHPRMCGDHSKSWPSMSGMLGSPPHVRGPPSIFLVVMLVIGITPACAGTTPISDKGMYYMWDHPRMCGDHAYPLTLMIYIGGSPPHVRGPLKK